MSVAPSPETSVGLFVERLVDGEYPHVFQSCLCQQYPVPGVAVVPIKARGVDQMDGREAEFLEVPTC